MRLRARSDRAEADAAAGHAKGGKLVRNSPDEGGKLVRNPPRKGGKLVGANSPTTDPSFARPVAVASSDTSYSIGRLVGDGAVLRAYTP